MAPDFPSLKANELLRALCREPLAYRITHSGGSHRRLTSDAGYPPLVFAFHDRQTIAPGLVRKVLCKDVGLDPETALGILGR